MFPKLLISLVIIFEISLKNKLTWTSDSKKKLTKASLPFAKITVILRIVVAVSGIPLGKVESQN